MTAEQRRIAVGLAQATPAISERKAYWYLGVARSTVQYQSRRPEQVELRSRLQQLAAERRPRGYRRLHVLLDREGWAVNHKQVHRLYVDEGLQVRRRRRKRVSRPRRTIERWRRDYNRARPHSSLENLMPREFVEQAESATRHWAEVA